VGVPDLEQLKAGYTQFVAQLGICGEADVAERMTLDSLSGASRPKKPLPKKLTRDRKAVILGVVKINRPFGRRILQHSLKKAK